MNTLSSYVFSISLAIVSVGATAFANNQAVPSDSSKNRPAMATALKDSSRSDSIKATAPANTLKGQSTRDPANKTDTIGQAQYQSTLPAIRRDIPQSTAIGPKQQREKFITSADTVKPQVRKDSILIVINNSQGNPAGKAQIKKSGVFIALGMCALLGAGIAAYVMKSSPAGSSAASIAGIPPPPNPPSNFAPSP